MEMQEAGTALIMAIVAAAIGFSAVDSQTALVNFDVVDTETEWGNAEASSTNVVYTDGVLKLNDSQTSGTFTTVDYTIDGNNLTEILVNSDISNTSNSSLTADIEYKDSGGTVQETVTVDLNDGTVDQDLNETYNQFSITYNLDRDSSSVDSPSVDYYKVKQEKESSLTLDLMKYGVALFALAVVGVVMN